MVPELFHKDVSESPYTGCMGTMLPMVTWCLANFGHLTMLTFQCYFKCKTYLTRYRYLIREESSCTITWYEKKQI